MADKNINDTAIGVSIADTDYMLTSDVSTGGMITRVPISVVKTALNVDDESDGIYNSLNSTGGSIQAAGKEVTKKWQSGLVYAIDTAVIHNGSVYLCKAIHTAGSTSEPGVGGVAASYWILPSQDIFLLKTDALSKTNTVAYTPTGDYNPATKKYVADAVALGVSQQLASPAFTGVPTAPTAMANSNSTQLATTAFAKKEADDAQAYAAQRINHTGLQAKETINGLVTDLYTLQLSINDKLPLGGGTLTGSLVLAGAPTEDLHATTKAYVDTFGSGVTHAAIIAGNPHMVTKTEVGLGLVPDYDFTVEVNLNTAKVSNITTNLSYTTAATTGTVVSSDGTDATIPAATTALAGLLTGADKTKLDGIATGATANAGTVTEVTATAPVVSSGGAAPIISIPAATSLVNGYMTSAFANKLNDIEAGAQANAVTSVASRTGAIVLTKSDVGLSSVDNTADASKPISTYTQAALNDKLSTASYTAADVLTKLKTVDGSESGIDADLLDGQQGSFYAPKASTLSGYGITDAYTKAEVDSRVTANDRIANVRSFGAIGDGVADDTAAIAAALADIVDTGGILYFPGGVYKNTGIVISNPTTGGNNHVSILGDGISATKLKQSTSNPVITMTGLGTSSQSGINSYQRISGLTLEGAVGGGTSIGLSVNQLAWFEVEDVFANGFQYAVYGIDVLSCSFEDCFFGWNTYGMRLERVEGGDYSTGPNAIMLTNCHFGHNSSYAIWSIQGANFNMIGGTVEGCGTAGNYSNAMIQITNHGFEGGTGANIEGVYFENNVGAADVLINDGGVTNLQFATANRISGCTFHRISSSQYVTNNIKITNSTGVKTTLAVSGCGFKGATSTSLTEKLGTNGSYVPSAERMTIAATGNLVTIGNGGGNMFTHAIDTFAFPTSGIAATDVTTLYSGGVAKLTAAASAVTAPNGVTFNIGTSGLTSPCNIFGNASVGGNVFVNGVIDQQVNSGRNEFAAPVTCQYGLTVTGTASVTKVSTNAIAAPSGSLIVTGSIGSSNNIVATNQIMSSAGTGSSALIRMQDGSSISFTWTGSSVRVFRNQVFYKDI